ncbi:Anthocyanidin 5,3-O-glucosyltransferase [Morella rubra]|uniref:Glycosyltransferase n=1 Tax=Morella rubra TaxID=262757 RepID=A0A6A1UWX8_9ROSI|nr:Anthocyanidin 5,3-O-glucosyltransferase [Morella rubra]
MEDAIVLYPFPGSGHLISMVELGKLLLKHHPAVSIIVLMLNTQNIHSTSAARYAASPTTQYIASVKATTPSITFHHLPPVSDVPCTSSTVEFFSLFSNLNNPKVHQALQTISQTAKLKALVIDFFCDAAFDVAANLSIPTYYFYTAGASSLAVFLYWPALHKRFDKSFKDLKDMLIDIPGLPSIPTSHLPEPMRDRNAKDYEHFLLTAGHMIKSSGFIVNTFEQLEKKAINAISDGLCVLDGPTPPIFCIGPLTSDSNQHGNDQHECLNYWLDSQPRQSVVFLCFGSVGSFSEKQLKEMAIGLENSGKRFLWVVRNPPPEIDVEPKLDELLPEGFLERTKDRGFVVKQWAPQVEVLRHDSVGGFVSHCGWNSVLEAVREGVPMVAWPLYAEQPVNKEVLVKELKLALEVNVSEDGCVTAAELEKRVSELMDSSAGKDVRERISAMRDAGSTAMKEGGSSHLALSKLSELWFRKTCQSRQHYEKHEASYSMPEVTLFT